VIKHIFGKMVSCVVVNVVSLTIAGKMYRSVKGIARSMCRGIFTAAITDGGRRMVTHIIVTIDKIRRPFFKWRTGQYHKTGKYGKKTSLHTK
jgi:hypothetical protein